MQVHTYLSVYERILVAECQATEQVEGNPTNKVAKDDVISARVAGYLLIELWNRRMVLTEKPCQWLVRSLVSPHQDNGDSCKTIFDVGHFCRDYFLRLCAFDPFHIPFSIPTPL